MNLQQKIANYTEQYALSDLHIHSDKPISIRVDGEIITFDEDQTEAAQLESFVNQQLQQVGMLDEFQQQKDADLAIEIGSYRYRANFYHISTGLAVVMRKIDTEIPSMELLGLPEIVHQISESENGLILVTGPTGSGKSTSLAAMIDKINGERQANIITIEDPIEFIHPNKRSIVSQREVGRDTISFSRALRASLREDPDVILVGEMRDLETIQLALTAAETGHLVFGTLHTNGAPSTINRIIDVFPPTQQDQVRAQLSQALRMVMTQRLHRKREGKGRVASFEIMVVNNAVRNLVREQKIHQLHSVMQTARAEGMMTMDASIQSLVSKGEIDPVSLQF
ncbi:MAG: PilT/PilU family type 4a pilus ATPase [Candidatus Marinimicrobia bacterium]|nr:PilT/PilU family type 4a pilus ATPase [Candidatus Neomarinimicrobiota bacterium]MBT4328384.1 PilT/PilU family type 4a pilus ATPase [Gammaproteobacteria bacterium]MBT4945913.1 PilT/PilU family type 4a pilus ATPase [Candidatus Neomarinimicrobiota bacterium]MBT5371337.1 PilT/PilU family type 4a pilus ATPase [Gammaproteobacteria bacterium]MBT5746865.1 PilT/PilU family type 4a pilus ATPase [Gammaproteobacteria bacterium]